MYLFHPKRLRNPGLSSPFPSFRNLFVPVFEKNHIYFFYFSFLTIFSGGSPSGNNGGSLRSSNSSYYISGLLNQRYYNNFSVSVFVSVPIIIIIIILPIERMDFPTLTSLILTFLITIIPITAVKAKIKRGWIFPTLKQYLTIQFWTINIANPCFNSSRMYWIARWVPRPYVYLYILDTYVSSGLSSTYDDIR